MVDFTSVHNGHSWTLVTVYGPCQGIERDNFVAWLYSLQNSAMSNWLLLGDFNFIRSPENRNRPGGDVNDMFLFNDIIGHLGLVELPLKGRSYTWLMHIKYIHELCTITLVFHSYLHHIRGILLLFNDFW